MLPRAARQHCCSLGSCSLTSIQGGQHKESQQVLDTCLLHAPCQAPEPTSRPARVGASAAALSHQRWLLRRGSQQPAPLLAGSSKWAYPLRASSGAGQGGVCALLLELERKASKQEVAG